MMKHKYIAWLFFFCSSTGVMGQQVIQSAENTFSVSAISTWDTSDSYLKPIVESDPLAVRLFKGYFHPASFEAYKSFFLPGDWGGFSKAQFDAWQLHLNSNKVTLEKTISLKDASGSEFIVCQYTVETKEYIMPGTAIFKKVGKDWKHISFINDKQAADLKQIGLLETMDLESIPTNGRPGSLARMQSRQIVPIEKFDREQLFQRISPLLMENSVTAADLDLAHTLFKEKAEVEMVQYLSQTYGLDRYDLMKELNQTIGFSLFKFVNTLKTN